ncbi:MAG: PP2C family protein-serine/threonine phosphatase [Bdellovibrio sp.]
MSEKNPNQQIQDLQQQLRHRDEELARYRAELLKTNAMLEAMIGDLSQDLKMAALIQRVLSPTEIPNISGVEFSTKFLAGSDSGGDYFDVFEHEDKLKFGIVVASSSGYAMSALFLSVLIQMSSRIEARKGLSPEIVLQQMAQEIVPNVHEKDQAHIFYAVMDRRNFELSFSSCGPIAAFHQSEESDSWSRIEPTAPALAKGFSANPMKQSLIMGPRDRIVLCTQGVMSAKNKDGEEFGHDRLLRCLKQAPEAGVHEVRNEVLFQVEKFSGLVEPFRDQTVVVMEVKDRVIKLAKR